jgi:hypothetical protein
VAIVGDLIGFCVVAFLAVAALSIFTTKTPRTPAFARRAASSSSPQLRHDANARFFADRGFLFRRRHWFVATCCPPVKVGAANYQTYSEAAPRRPVPVATTGGRTWWWFDGDFYWESGRYAERDVLALIRDRQRRATQRLDRAHMLLNVDEGNIEKPRPHHPGRSRRGNVRAEPAAPLRRLQPRKGRQPVAVAEAMALTADS